MPNASVAWGEALSSVPVLVGPLEPGKQQVETGASDLASLLCLSTGCHR